MIGPMTELSRKANLKHLGNAKHIFIKGVYILPANGGPVKFPIPWHNKIKP